MSVLHEQVVIPVPDSGTVMCPKCERPMGEFDSEHAQWWCRNCRLEIVIRLGSVVLEQGRLSANVPGDKRSLITAAITANLQALANIQSLVPLIEALPD